MPLGTWHFSQWTCHTLYLLVVHPCILSEPGLGVSDLLPTVLWSQAPPDSHAQQLGRLRGSVCRFLFVQKTEQRAFSNPTLRATMSMCPW